MHRALHSLILLVAALAGCRWDSPPAPRPPPPPAPLLTRDDQVRLVVFGELRRRREDFYRDSAPSRIHAFYLCLWSEEEDLDPGDDLLAALGNRALPLRKVSQCLRERSVGDVIHVCCVDKETHRPGCILWVGEIFWLDDDTAELDAGWWESGLASGGQTVQVHWGRGHWAIRYAGRLGAP